MSKKQEISMLYESSEKKVDLISIEQERENGKSLRWMITIKCNKCKHIDKKRFRGKFECTKCNLSNRNKLSEEDLINYVKKNAKGYKFIRSWMNYETHRMEVSCPNNHIYNCAVQDFKKGRRCMDCYIPLKNERVNKEIEEYFLKHEDFYRMV